MKKQQIPKIHIAAVTKLVHRF